VNYRQRKRDKIKWKPVYFWVCLDEWIGAPILVFFFFFLIANFQQMFCSFIFFATENFKVILFSTLLLRI
jgi:hypothetical protein